MFVQVIQGRVADRSRLQEQLERWSRELKPGATGFLGATSGVADDGEFVALVRFESEEAAVANSQRPEQGAWWAETERCFDGAATFQDCDQSDLFLGGGTDSAGFVQVMQGRGDREQLRRHGDEMEAFLRRIRPDVLGGIVAWHRDEPGRYTQAVYFSSEADARKGESQELSEEDKAAVGELMSGFQDERYVDLRQPRLESA